MEWELHPWSYPIFSPVITFIKNFFIFDTITNVPIPPVPFAHLYPTLFPSLCHHHTIVCVLSKCWFLVIALYVALLYSHVWKYYINLIQTKIDLDILEHQWRLLKVHRFKLCVLIIYSNFLYILSWSCYFLIWLSTSATKITMKESFSRFSRIARIMEYWKCPSVFPGCFLVK